MFNTATLPLEPPADFESSCIDVTALVGRCMGDSSLALQLLQLFGERLAPTLNEIERQIAEGQLLQAARTAHGLKGEAGNISAVPLHLAVTRLESELKLNSPGDVAPALAAVKSEIQSFRAALPTALDWLTE